MTVACDVCKATLDADLLHDPSGRTWGVHVDGYLCRPCWEVHALDEYDGAPMVVVLSVLSRLARERGLSKDTPVSALGDLPPLRLLRAEASAR
jgi:hypothetical protein